MTTGTFFRDSTPQSIDHSADLPTISIRGIPVFDGSAEQAVEACLALVRRGGRVATANLDFFALARRDPRLQEHLANSSLVIADGMPVVWLARLSGASKIRRLAGVDLVEAIFRTDRESPLRVAIYGSTAELCDRAVPMLEAMGSGARVIHRAHPPFRPLTAEEMVSERRALSLARPDVVLVALGCPRQEQLIAEWFAELPQAVWIGVGGTFDFFAGVRRRAPRAAQAAGLEWLVRMVQEPRRLGRRYLGRDLPTLFSLIPACLGARWSRS